MTRKTPGERIAKMYARRLHPLEAHGLAVNVDIAIRRAQAEAWERGYESCRDGDNLAANPYRGRARK